MNLPNLITLIRIAIVPVFFSVLIQTPEQSPQARFYAGGIFCAAVFTDALDGLFARLLKQHTELGMFLDPLADKLLILSGFFGILLTSQPVHRLPAWILVIILFREIVIALGFLTLFFFSKNIHFKPNRLGKITTTAQMALILFCIFDWPHALALAYASAALTIASGIVYTTRELTQFS